MIRRSTTTTLLLLMATAAAAAPELRIAATCDTAAAARGAPFTAAVELFAGGQATAVSALDFELAFDPAGLAVTAVRLAPALAASGAWSDPDWDGTLFPSLPPPSGSAQIALAPKLAVPLPTLPDGPVLEIDFMVAPGTAPACLGIGFAPGSAVFSAPPIGVAIAGGTTVDGSVAIDGEVCGDCIDNNDDGAIDLDDQRCGALDLAVKKTRLPAGRSGKVRLKAEIGTLLDQVDEGIRLTVTTDLGVVLCSALAGEKFETKGRKKRVFSLAPGADPRIKKLTLKPNAKRGRTSLRVTLQDVTVDPQARRLGVSLQAGGGRYQRDGALVPKKKGLVFTP